MSLCSSRIVIFDRKYWKYDIEDLLCNKFFVNKSASDVAMTSSVAVTPKGRGFNVMANTRHMLLKLS